MKSRFYFWSVVLVSSLVLTGLCMRVLALQGIPFHQSLSTRGLVCLVLTVAFGMMGRMSLIPKRPLVQGTRALIAGLALTFLTLSYNWLTASAISVLSNIDVPLLIALGPLIGVKSSARSRTIAILSVALLFFYVCGLDGQENLFLGLGSLGMGTFLLCFGYFFIKKSMGEENQAVTIAVPSLAIIGFGLIQGWMGPSSSASATVLWTPTAIALAAGAGVGMFFAYFATMKLYSLADLAQAEFPGLFAAIVIQPLETFFLGMPLGHASFLASALYVLAIYFMIQQDLTKVRN